MPLFEVAIIAKPDKDGNGEKIVAEPTCYIAKNAQAAGFKAVAGLAAGSDLDNLEVLVRPFA
jgi:hypothetical protein